MAGAGKTACALELAYRHADSFAALAFWQAPTQEEEWPGALADLAARLEIQLGDYGFTMSAHIGTEAAFRAYAPRLRRMLADSGLLLVLDNLETLLTPDGQWRDPRFEPLVAALVDHDGESRVILTSRIVPAGLGPVAGRGRAPRVLTLPVHAMPLPEAAALARELPNLRALLGSGSGDDLDRVRRVLRVVQGHPKLMELADAAAADRNRLDAQLAAAETVADGQGLEEFFRSGSSVLGSAEFLASLTRWTLAELDTMPPATRLMAQFAACLEDSDRSWPVIEANWADLWRRLGRAGDAPAPGPLLAQLAAAMLVEQEAAPESDGEAQGATYRLHPGIQAAVAASARAGEREAVDAELAAFWRAVFDQARSREDSEDSALVVRAGLAAVPYLLRLREWNVASFLLEQAVIRDGSPGVTQAALPPLRRIAEATGTPADAGLLASVLMRVDPGEAERLLRGATAAAAEAGDYKAASFTAGQLVNLLRDAGQLSEALAGAEQKTEFTRRSGLGPWSQLSDEAQRLQVLGLMGQHNQVLAEVGRLRASMAGLPVRGGRDESAPPWRVRETILAIGETSARATGEWVQSLELNAEIVASARSRGAGAYEIARVRFTAAGPLTRLGRLEEAGQLLAECQTVFEDNGDTASLAAVLGTRASLESVRGNGRAAAELERTALRLSYLQPQPRRIAQIHGNLASDLAGLGGDRAAQRAHRLAATLIYRLSGMSHDLARAVGFLANELHADGGTDASLPFTVAELVQVAERTEGVRLGALLAALQPDPGVVEQALTEVVQAAFAQEAPA